MPGSFGRQACAPQLTLQFALLLAARPSSILTLLACCDSPALLPCLPQVGQRLGYHGLGLGALTKQVLGFQPPKDRKVRPIFKTV